MKYFTPSFFVAIAALSLNASAQTRDAARQDISSPALFWITEGENPSPTAPTLANVPYGEHEKQVLDFWKAESTKPTPLVFFIHGGAWRSNDKNKVTGVKEYLAAGISVVSINYRFVQEAATADVQPPVKWPLDDAARALQFVRSKSIEWNIDKTRVGASGGSAGACSSLWLAFHDDMAIPDSDDPIARESTRLTCAGVFGAQTSLDPKQMRDWTPNSAYGGHAFGFATFQQFFNGREKILEWIQEYSPYELASQDDPPVFLHYAMKPEIGAKQKDPTHTANFGVKLQERLNEVSVECHLMFPGAKKADYPNPIQFLIAKLNATK